MGRRPFKAYLDVGLVRTTTGNRVFGAMKGACDGGLYIPHNEKRFPGHRIEKKEDPDAFKRQFSKWEKELKGRSFEDVYKDLHAKIKKNPARQKKKGNSKPTRKVIQKAPILIQQNSKGKKWLRLKKIGLEARK